MPEKSEAPHPDRCAPSWSWASTSGNIAHIYSPNSTILADIQAVEVIPASGDIFGRLTHAHIDMSAPSLSIPDPRLLPERDHSAFILLRDLRESHLSCEYFQHHVPHECQEFALVKLVFEDGYPGGVICLVIKSCGDGTWRRLFCYEFKVAKETGDQPPFTRYGMTAEAMERTQWQTRSFRLI
nr:hypothetical protein B0A51_04927 [Rachicladosporium sp. CCFEE 5018]